MGLFWHIGHTAPWWKNSAYGPGYSLIKHTFSTFLDPLQYVKRSRVLPMWLGTKQGKVSLGSVFTGARKPVYYVGHKLHCCWCWTQNTRFHILLIVYGQFLSIFTVLFTLPRFYPTSWLVSSLHGHTVKTNATSDNKLDILLKSHLALGYKPHQLLN